MNDPIGYQTLQHLQQAPVFNEWVIEQFVPYLKGPVLEIGSGIGNLTACLLQKNIEVTATDIDPTYLTQLKQQFGSHPQLAGIESLDLDQPLKPDNKIYQTILLVNVLEHIPDPQKALKELRPKLAPNGKIIVLVPAYRWLYCRLDRELGHHRRYNQNTLCQELIDAGYQLDKISSFNAMGLLGWTLWGKLLNGKLLNKSLITTYEKLMPLNKGVDKLFQNRIGLSLIAIASVK